MKTSIVITFIGEDRPGIVESISSIITQFNGEWVESRLANLSGKFTGILSVNLPNSDVDAAINHLETNPIDGIHLQVEKVINDQIKSKGKCINLELVGHDHPGIVHRVSSLLASNGVSVDSLESEIFDAPMTGEKLFKSNLSICIKDEDKLDEVCEALEQLGIELLVDIDVD